MLNSVFNYFLITFNFYLNFQNIKCLSILQVSQAKFLRAKTVLRSYHHITREMVEEGGKKADHASREVERLVGNI